MFTTEDRDALIAIFEKLKTSVDDCLLNHDVLPASITHNGENVGITIEFHKCDSETEDEVLISDAHPGEV